jgi:hypothetical protein
LQHSDALRDKKKAASSSGFKYDGSNVVRRTHMSEHSCLLSVCVATACILVNADAAVILQSFNAAAFYSNAPVSARELAPPFRTHCFNTSFVASYTARADLDE